MRQDAHLIMFPARETNACRRKSMGPKLATALVLALGLAAGAAADGFKVYPGATKYTPPQNENTKEFMENLRPGVTMTAYLTTDSFEQVVAFYKGLGREFASPKTHTSPKLPNGQEVKKAFVIFDGAPTPMKSRSWVSVRRPFLGAVTHIGNTPPQYNDVRDVTEIVLTEKKDVPKEEEKSGPDKK